MRSQTNNMKDIVINYTGIPAEPRISEEQRQQGKMRRKLEHRQADRALERNLREVWD